ncbi:MAG: NIPSNAP family protein [Planctomycetaceae bacterium]
MPRTLPAPLAVLLVAIVAATLAASPAAALAASPAAGADTRLYEMRTYWAPEGKLDALHARFRDHTTKLFAKHGMTNVGYFVPAGANPERKLVYFLAYADRAARDASWKAFLDDPDWKAAHAASEKEGPLVSRITETFLVTTDYSPALDTKPGKAGRVFELRSYTATPNNLPHLDARFRDHTVKLFAKHGMTNLIYWHLAPGAANAERKLVYLLAHDSTDAAKQSFDTFRQDPEWMAARKASEEKAGGSLTEATDGVLSEFLVPTDYSPWK